MTKAEEKAFSERDAALFYMGYKQAEKDINKEMMDRMAEIKEKQKKAALADLDYDIRFDPAMGFDLGCVSLYHGKDIITTSQVVDAEIVRDIHNLLHVKSAALPMPSEYRFGDKVKIIILPDETDNR